MSDHWQAMVVTKLRHLAIGESIGVTCAGQGALGPAY